MCVVGALYMLADAIDLSRSIKEDGERNCILQHLSELKSELQTSIQNKDFRNIGDSCTYVCENAYEMLAECSDFELRTKILSCLCSMAKEVEKL